MKAKNPTPPRLPQKILFWFLRDDLVEEVTGDLDEKFSSMVRNRSLFRARIGYWYQVVNYLRPFAIRKLGRIRSNLAPMVRHNFIISFRHFRKFKGSFVINVAGLSTGLACAILIYLWVNNELQIDRFHFNNPVLYQVMKINPQADGTLETIPNTPAHMAEEMARDFPEILYAVPAVYPSESGVLSFNGKHVKVKHVFAGDDFFKVFSFPVLGGMPEQALSDKYSVLISDRIAEILFGTAANATGKHIALDWWDKFSGGYEVAGVFTSPGANSSMQFDVIFSHDLWIDKLDDNCWCSNNAHTYVVVRPGTDIETFNKKIKDYSKNKLVEFEGPDALEWEGALFVQRFSDRYLYGQYENGVVSGGRIEYLKLFSITGIAILIIACINFMNLFTAKASRRMKEVGIKKIAGAGRGTLIAQYMGESITISVFSLLIACMIIYMLLSPFETLTGKQLSLGLNTNLFGLIGGITLITGIISGSYPAIYLSGFSPVSILKGRLNKQGSDDFIRKTLVVFQFTVSMLFIVIVIVVHRQIDFIQSRNLGFDKENIIQFSNEGKMRTGAVSFIDEIKRFPGVVNASTMSGDLVGSHSGGGGIDWVGKRTGIEFSGLYVEHGLLETLGVQLVKGRSFSHEGGGDRDKVIFNETAIAMMGFKDPIGQIVNMWGKPRQIIGIVKDFHYESFYERIGPFFFVCSADNENTVIRIKAGMEEETVSRIGQFYKTYTGGLPFEFHFLDQDYETLYATENRIAVLSRYFAAVAILISCLGLLGLAAFTAERRTKEIGIRKVLGSTAAGIMWLLSRDFAKLVAIASIVSLPIAILLCLKWLDTFAYRIPLEWWYFVVSGFAALLISLLTIGAQVVRAASENPVVSLRGE